MIWHLGWHDQVPTMALFLLNRTGGIEVTRSPYRVPSMSLHFIDVRAPDDMGTSAERLGNRR